MSNLMRWIERMSYMNAARMRHRVTGETRGHHQPTSPEHDRKRAKRFSEKIMLKRQAEAP